MRITLALTILSLLVANGATRSAAPAVFALQAAPAGDSQGDTAMGPTETDLVKWAFTQGGLMLVLIVVLLSYRRDFFRKAESHQLQIDALREEKRDLVRVLEQNASAMVNHAVATAANTKATELLAQNVNNLAERRMWPRPSTEGGA